MSTPGDRPVRGAEPRLPADPSLRTAAALARIATLRVDHADRDRLLRRTALLVRDAVPAAAWVTLSLGPPLAPSRLGSDAGPAEDFAARERSAREGPRQDAYAGGTPVDTPDVTADPRWPVLAPLAAESPVRSVLALPVSENRELTGVLALYAPRTAAFDAANRRLADHVATAVSGALRSAAERRALRELAGHLEQALTSRATIDQAKGMIMARFGGGPDEAFGRLVTMSNRLNVRLRTLAAEITAGRLDELLDEPR